MTAAIVRLGVAAAVWTAAAATLSAQPSTSVPVLDVPYVLQSEELCGGAAAAMVMRYWGATGIYAESFAPLLDRNLRGITGAALIHDLQNRGWQAASMGGDPALIRQALQQRRPPIALIEVRPGRFHYVVILRWDRGKVVVHDPARAPFTTHLETDFLRAWDRSGRWTLMVLPSAPPERAPKPFDADTPGSTPGVCGPAVDRAVALANANDMDAARQQLEEAAARCPREPAARRELAGLYALQKDWPRAAADARRALAIDGNDEHAARILATSLYLEGDANGALAAWNRTGEPSVDLVEVRGLERTRFAAAVAAIGVKPQTTLTPARLTRAARRLDAVPAFMGTRLTYTPRDEGLAQVSAAVIERPLLPSSVFAAGATVLRMATDRELRVNVASPFRGGELFYGSWRWWSSRPRRAAGMEAPAPFGGTWAIAAVSERESYGDSLNPLEQRRETLSFSFASWVTGAVKVQAGVARERWPSGAAAGPSLGARYQTPGDRFSVEVGGTAWPNRNRAWTTSGIVEWRSRARNEGVVWLGRGALKRAGAETPYALWNGAGAGQGRDELLRAHPLLDDGVIRDAVFGRGLAAGTMEWRRWSGPVKRVLRVAPALFVDAARAFNVPEFGDNRGQVDAGGGVRLAIPGAGVVRADVAVGLRDRNVALSFGWGR